MGDTGDDLDGGIEKRKGTISLLKGPTPTLHPAKTPAQQWKYVSGEIKRMQKEGLQLSDIAIFSRTNTSLQAIQTALQRSRIKSQLIQPEQVDREGVQIGTLHRAKGLEFKAVFVVNVSDEMLPLRSLLHNVQDQQLRTELLARERQLLYVGLTRARDEAVLTWVGYPSQFLEDILTELELKTLEANMEKFTIYDRAFVAARRRERGYGTNTWKPHNRFIISHSLLRDETYAVPLRDWLGDFSESSMLILDEAHNAAPASGAKYAVDSQLTTLLQAYRDCREQRLMLILESLSESTESSM